MVFNTEDNNQLANKLRDSFANVYISDFIYTLCEREYGREKGKTFLPSSLLEQFKQRYIYKNKNKKVSYDQNSELLDELKRFDGWFTEIIECLQIQDCPQTDVISEMIRIKDEHEKMSSSSSKGNNKSVTQSLAPTSLRGKKRKSIDEQKDKSSELRNDTHVSSSICKKKGNSIEENSVTPPMTIKKRRNIKVKKTKSPSLLKNVQDNKSSNNNCLCGNCPYSKRNKLCCFSIIKAVSEKNPNENRNICMSKWKCIINKVTNKKFLQKNQSEFFKSPPNTNRAYFKLACKFYIRQMYGVLGQGKGRLIPSCILNEIGRKFPC